MELHNQFSANPMELFNKGVTQTIGANTTPLEQIFGFKSNRTYVAESDNTLQNSGNPAELANTAYSVYHRPNQDEQRSLFLGQKITGLWVEFPSVFISEILPLVSVTRPNFMWTDVRMNKQLARLAPPESVPDVLTSESRNFYAQLRTRGLKFETEMEFWATTQGLEDYKRKIELLRLCVLETLDAQVKNCIIEASRQNEYIWPLPALIDNQSRDLIRKFEVKFFDACHKGLREISILISNIKQTQSRNNCDPPDLILVPPHLKTYFSTGDPKTIDYYMAGPRGPERLEGAPDSGSIFAGLRVEEMSAFNVTEDMTYLKVLDSRVSIGEYFILRDKSYENRSCAKKKEENAIYVHSFSRSFQKN